VGAAFQRALSREHDVVVVETAADALARLASGEPFDAVFCDVNVPMMGGVDLYEAIEQSLPRLTPRIVMITGGGHDVRTTEFLNTREAVMLEKPLDMTQVRALLAKMLSGVGS
jgi:DNA-binding NtrC family response regulator